MALAWCGARRGQPSQTLPSAEKNLRRRPGLIKSFRIVPASVGPRREFKITLGLRAGYGSAERIYDLEEAVRTAHRWMWERATRGEPFLSGMFTRGEVVYADSGGEAASHREPVAIFAGEVLPQYSGDLDDGTVRELLDELAGEMGRTSNRRRCISPMAIGPGH